MSRQPRPISVCDLSLSYSRHPAVRHLCCHFAPGSLTAVVGPNGAGKSTLLKALAGLLPPRGGRIDLGGQSVRDLAYLPQQAAIDRSFPITVQDMVSLGHWPRVGAWGALGRAQWQAVQAALAALDLADFGARPISALSVGQFQRVQFARLLLQDAPVILLDEPFTALDARTTDDLLALVRRWHIEGRTVVAVIHDLEQVRAHFPQSLLFARDPIAFGPTAQVLTSGNLAGRGIFPPAGTARWRSRTARRRMGRRGERHDHVVDVALSALCGICLHAPRPGGHPGPGSGLRPGGHLSGTAAHEPYGRRPVPRRTAGGGGGLFALRAFAHGHDCGRFSGRAGRGGGGGLGFALHPPARGRQPGGLYLISLALGVLLVSLRGNSMDLMHVLFGSILAVDDASLLLVAGVASVSLLTLALIYRPLVVECFDPGFLRSVGGGGPWVHTLFMALVALNLVGGFRALGTLMAVGLLVLPATAARFWAGQVWSQALVATGIAMFSGYLGLLCSYYWNLPSGPAIVLTAGACHCVSLFVGPRQGLVFLRRRARGAQGQ